MIDIILGLLIFIVSVILNYIVFIQFGVNLISMIIAFFLSYGIGCFVVHLNE